MDSEVSKFPKYGRDRRRGYEGTQIILSIGGNSGFGGHQSIEGVKMLKYWRRLRVGTKESVS